MHNVQDVEQLALILMHPFNLYIKERLRIDRYPCELPDDDGKPCLVSSLDAEELLLKSRIWRTRFQRFECFQIRNPRRTDGVRQQLRQEGVGLQQPAALGNAIRFIVKTFRPELEEI
jgi:hypothetical protein